MTITQTGRFLLLVTIALITCGGCRDSRTFHTAETTLSQELDSSSLIPEGAINQTQVSVWAGTADWGFMDGANLDASFIKPYGLTAMPDGSILIVDSYANLLRTAQDGSIQTIAGNTETLDETGYPLAGYLNGQGSVSILNRPRFAQVSGEGVIVFSDTGNHRIRVIADGVVSLLAGDGTAGFQNGDYLQAQFNTPSGIAIGVDGTVYVADTLNHCIRSISPDGQVFTLAGTPNVAGFQDGPPAEALFCEPNDIQLGPDGALYVVDKGNQRIRKIVQDQVSTIAGSGEEQNPATGYIIGGYSDGDAMKAQFLNPTGLYVEQDGTIFLADTGNHCIRKISPDGQVTTVTGSRMAGNLDGAMAQARFNQPIDVICLNQTLYVSDSYNHIIRSVQLEE